MEKELLHNILESFGLPKEYYTAKKGNEDFWNSVGRPTFTANEIRKMNKEKLQVENYYCKLKNKDLIISIIDDLNLPYILKMNFIDSLEKYSRRLGANINGTFLWLVPPPWEVLQRWKIFSLKMKKF